MSLQAWEKNWTKSLKIWFHVCNAQWKQNEIKWFIFVHVLTNKKRIEVLHWKQRMPFQKRQSYGLRQCFSIFLLPRNLRKCLLSSWNPMQWSKCLYCNNRIEPWLRISSQANFGLFQRNPWQPLAEPWGSAEPPLKNTGLRTSGLSKRHAASANNRPALLVELETKFCKVRNTVYKTCCTVTTYFSI